MSDNFHIDIVHGGDLTDAMKIAFSGAPGGKAEAYAVHPKKGLVFLWGGKEGIALPFKLDAAGAADFAKRWLAEADYGREPDHDGDNSKGWRIYNDSWAKVEGFSYSIVAVQPAWLMHGK